MSSFPASFDDIIFQGDKVISQGHSVFRILRASLMKFITFNQTNIVQSAFCELGSAKGKSTIVTVGMFPISVGSFSRSHNSLKKEEDCIIEKVLAAWRCMNYLPCVDAKATKSIQHMTGHEHTMKRKLSLLFLIPCDLEIKPRSAKLD